MKTRAPRNRTLTCSPGEICDLSEEVIYIAEDVTLQAVENRVIHQDIFQISQHFPIGFVDLLILDPPYTPFQELQRTPIHAKRTFRIPKMVCFRCSNSKTIVEIHGHGLCLLGLENISVDCACS